MPEQASPAAPPARESDSGVTVVEYSALLAVLAVIMTAIIATSLPRMMVGIEKALCDIFGGDCGNSQQAAPPQPPLNQCVTQQVLDQQQSGVKIIAFGHEDQSTTQVQSLGDGGVNITTSNKSGDGVDIEAGLGVGVGPIKLGVSIGGGMLWTGSDQTRFQYEDTDQAEEHQQRMESAIEDFLDEYGFSSFTDDDLSARLQQIPFDIAEDMDVPYTIINAEGTDAFVEVNGSAGVSRGDGTIGLGGSVRQRDSELLGTSESVDADGNTVYGDYHSVGQSRAGDIGLGVYWRNIGPRAVRDFTWTDGNVIHVQYDENGDPMRVTSTTTTDWHTGGGGTVQVQARLGGDPSGGGRVQPSNRAGGGPTYRVRDGDVTVTTTTVDIPAYQRAEVADELHTFFEDDFSGFIQEGVPTLAQLAQGPGGTTTVQTYDSEQSDHTNGIPIDIDVGIEWIDIGGSSRHQEMQLREASIVDPVTGAQLPWVTCEDAGGN